MMQPPLLLVLLLALPTATHGSWWDSVKQHAASVGLEAMGFRNDDDCGFTRTQALACLQEHVDFNHDGIITPNEFYRARDLYLPPQAKAAAWLARKFGYHFPLRHVVTDCNAAFVTCRAIFEQHCRHPTRERSAQQCLDHRLSANTTAPGHTSDYVRRICVHGLHAQCVNQSCTMCAIEAGTKEQCFNRAWDVWRYARVPASMIVFSPTDWMHTNKTCLPNPADLCKLKTVCDRAAALKHEAGLFP
jgi:hypothetical protein